MNKKTGKKKEMFVEKRENYGLRKKLAVGILYRRKSHSLSATYCLPAPPDNMSPRFLSPNTKIPPLPLSTLMWVRSSRGPWQKPTSCSSLTLQNPLTSVLAPVSFLYTNVYKLKLSPFVETSKTKYSLFSSFLFPSCLVISNLIFSTCLMVYGESK